MNAKLVLKVILGFVVLMIAIGILLHIIGIVAWFVHLTFVMAVLAAIVYAAFYCVRLSQRNASASSPASAKAASGKQFRLAGADQIFVFRQQPGVRDLIGMTNSIHAAKLELSGDVVPMPKGTHVIVLEDKGNESVKIRVQGTKKKDNLDGWVDRSYLRAEPN